MVTSLFAEEHDALRATLRRWVEREADARAAGWERDGGYPRELAAELGAQGWFAPALPAGHGGDVLAALVVAEELGRVRSGGATAALLAHAHATATLAAAAGARHKDVVEQAVAGERLLCLAGGDLAAEPLADGWRVSGRAPNLSGAAVADAAIVVAARRSGPVVLLVPTSYPGWRVSRPAALHGRRGGHVADVFLDDVEVPQDDVLASEEVGTALMLDRQARWRVDSAAAAVAAAWRTWEDTEAYALQREAFGRPIARFQVNRHALAEMATDLTAARALVHDTARRLQLGTLAPGDTARLRLRVAEVVNQAADRCLQLHGGYGYTTEFDVERAWRDARMLRMDEAGEEALREEIAAALEARPMEHR